MRKLLQLLLCLFIGITSVNAGETPDSAEETPVTAEEAPASDSRKSKGPAFYPEFSWNSTPQFLMFAASGGKRLLTDAERKIIAAKTDFICIEKQHAHILLKGAERGTKAEVNAFKKIKPSMKVLFYFNAAIAYPFTSYTRGFFPKKIKRNPSLKKFLLINPKTNKPNLHNNNFFTFDVLKPEFREWWSTTVARGIRDSGSDGVFIDQMHGFDWLRPRNKRNIDVAMGQMMKMLKEKMGKDKILLANNGANVRDVFSVADAVMFENYNPKQITKEGLLKQWWDMSRVAQAGKISVLRFAVETSRSRLGKLTRDQRKTKRPQLAKLSQERVEFYQACYLIGAQPYSYLLYNWDWELTDGPLIDYPSLLKAVGAPLSAFKRIDKNGWQFTREFEKVSVWVDTKKRRAKITWKP